MIHDSAGSFPFCLCLQSASFTVALLLYCSEASDNTELSLSLSLVLSLPFL